MIREVHIKNLAVIEDQTVTFTKGLNVITGETGSGKSVLMQAIELLLGGRPKGSPIRSGAESLEVSAVLELDAFPDSLRQDLPEVMRDSEELLINRIISANGKSKVYINGSLSSVSLLHDTLGKLVTLCGQSEHVHLLDPRYHVEIIDSFADHDQILSQYKQAWRIFKDLDEELKGRDEEDSKRAAREEELRVIHKEISPIGLKHGLREELEQTVKRLSNAEKLIQGTSQLSDAFSDKLSGISELQPTFSEISKLDDKAREFYDDFKGNIESLKIIQRDLLKYSQNLSIDESLLEEKRSQLAEIARLERKYRTNDTGLIELLENSEKELSKFEGASDLKTLKIERDKAFDNLLTIGAKLTSSRKSASKKLCQNVSHELQELNMKSVTLSVQMTPTSPTQLGCEKAEILIATNPGEPLKPLRQIASGGELSRIMLVLKKLLRGRGGVSILVFDEVDTGVSGGVARAIGQKLRALAQDAQVLCITHIPQVASLADNHVLVHKTSDKRARTELKILKEEEKIEEIARMLSGFKVTDSTRESARELLSSKDMQS